MRRRLLAAGAVIFVLAGCSSGSTSPASNGSTSPTSVAGSATPTAATTSAPSAATGTDDLEGQILMCGGFDIGAVYVNEAWPSIIAGHPKLGYGISLEKATDTWQRMLNDAPPGDITNAVALARRSVQALADAIRNGDSSAGPIDVSAPVQNIRNEYGYVEADCDRIGYKLLNPLKDK